MSSNLSQIGVALPYLSEELPGVGGLFKRYNEDFLVEELPLYPAGGQGTHVFFIVEKQGMTTLAAIQRIARALGRQPRDIGYAGLKDAHGVTRQWFSLEHIDEERILGVSINGMKVLSTTRHTNKLKLGHLAGNRFIIKLRETKPDPLGVAREILGLLQRRGVPNYFGPQRFGSRGDNALIGLAVVRDDYTEAIALMLGRPGPFDHGAVQRARELFDAGQLEESANTWPGPFDQQRRVCKALIKNNGDARGAWRAVDHTLRKLYISALQSDLFNRVLAHRLKALDRLETGDIAWKHVNGACFRVEDAAIEQPRCDAFEISATGPLHGRRMTEPTGRPAEIESAVLAEIDLDKDVVVAKDGGKLDGARRPLRVPLRDGDAATGTDERGPFLQVSFSLPAGSYATSVIHELCKTDVANSLRGE